MSTHTFPSGYFGTREQWLEREEQWRKFHEWAAEQPERMTPEQAWAWYESAWRLARELGAIPYPPRLDMERVEHLQKVQERLGRLKWLN